MNIDVYCICEGHAGNWTREADEFTGVQTVELDDDDIAAARQTCGPDADTDEIVEAAAAAKQRNDFFAECPDAPETICFAAKIIR